MIDLRTLYPALQTLLASAPGRPSFGPLKSYASLTELTRNPAETRSQIEKNWLLFFPTSGESYLHYDLSDPYNGPRGRTFAKLLGAGLTTTNLTDPLEIPCLHEAGADEEPDSMKRGGTWHQATNSLRLILCKRSDLSCKASSKNTVFFAVIHRKFPNYLNLPLRYERYFMVWSGVPPFTVLGVSKYPILMANETASGWTASENWSDDDANAEIVERAKKHRAVGTSASSGNGGRNSTVVGGEPFGGKDSWAYFTYTVSISYAWGREKDMAENKNVGYMDDEVVLGIGIDDEGQGFARVKAADLIQCLRACPGRARDTAGKIMKAGGG